MMVHPSSSAEAQGVFEPALPLLDSHQLDLGADEIDV